MAAPPRERPRYVIAEGFVTQFQQIREKYATIGSLAYQDFSDMWNKLSLNALTLPFPQPERTIQFLEECFDIIVPYLMPDHTPPDRVCAIYTLFGFYFNQKVVRNGQKVVKIPVTKDEWQGVHSLMKELRDTKHLEPFLAMRHLWSDNAFVAVLAKGQFYRAFEKTAIKQRFRTDLAPKGLSAFSQDVLPDLKFIHDEYVRIKESIPIDDYSGTTSLYSENIPEETARKIQECQSSFKQIATRQPRHATCDVEEPDPATVSDTDLDSAAQIRRGLMMKVTKSVREKEIERAKSRTGQGVKSAKK